MSDNPKKYWTDDPERMEQYVLDQISAEEKKQMDAEIADCEPCKKTLHQEMEIAAGIRRYGRDEMKSRLRKNIGRERTAQYYSFQYIGLAAAVIIIALGIGLYEIWFSDLVAPKQFQRQEIVLQTPKDSSSSRIEPQDLSESQRDLPPRADVTTSSPQRREPIRQSEQNEISEMQSDVAADQIAPSAGAVAEADALSSEQSSGESQPSAIWLIGQVVMVSDNVPTGISSASKMQTGSESNKSVAKERRSTVESKTEEPTIALRKVKNENVILQQRSMKDIPVNRSQQRAAVQQEVEILLERSEQGLVVTLYDDSVKESDLELAVLETFSNDSLVVTFPTQKIAFHLPAGWNIPSSRRR